MGQCAFRDGEEGAPGLSIPKVQDQPPTRHESSSAQIGLGETGTSPRAL